MRVQKNRGEDKKIIEDGLIDQIIWLRLIKIVAWKHRFLKSR